MKFHIFIPTYNRPEMCLRLLKQIDEQRGSHSIVVHVLNDASPENYRPVREYLRANFQFHCYESNPKRYGKSLFWKSVNKGFQFAKSSSWDYFMMIGDDCQLTPDFFTRAVAAFKSHPEIICLNLITEPIRAKAKIWTNIEAEEITPEITRNGWIDMAFICQSPFFELLNWSIDSVPASWADVKTRSSGVGMQISKRITRAGYYFHLKTHETLLIHEDHPSVMHPEERIKNPLISKPYQPGQTITASMATIPSRCNVLKKVVNSILPQVDKLNIFLNNYDHVPAWLNHPKIEVERSQDHCDLGDAGKFFWADRVKGYHLTIDDDLIYPPDYVKVMISHVDRHHGKKAISLHGRKYNVLPIATYYRSQFTVCVSCLRSFAGEISAHIVGTGVLAYHTDAVKVSIADFKARNMADIWFSICCHRQNVERLIVEHGEKWVREDESINPKDTIAAWHIRNDGLQTWAVNQEQCIINQTDTDMDTQHQLRPEVARRYFVPTIKPGKYNFKGFGDIDLTTLSIEQADALFERKFPFLKLKPVKTPEWASEQLPAVAQAPSPAVAQAAMPSDIDALRKNTFYINKILQMDWKDLNHIEKLIFHMDQPYFLSKKQALFTIAEINNQMGAFHAKMKVVKTDAERAALIKEITELDDSKRAYWTIIDDWSEPKMITEKPTKPEMTLEEFAERDRKIKAYNNYIWRNEAKTSDAKLPDEKRTFYATEVERRKQELIEMGAPYNRKTRK